MQPLKMLLVAAFVLLTGFSNSQNSCKELESQLDSTLDINLNEYFNLTKSLKQCEEKNRTPIAKSRHAYFHARYLMKNGELQKAESVIKSDLKTQANAGTINDLKILGVASFILEGKFEGAILALNQLLMDSKLSAKQYARVYQYMSHSHKELGNKSYANTFALKALHYARKDGDKHQMPTILSSIAGWYFDKADAKSHLKAIYYYKKALELNNPNDSSENGLYLLSIGQHYFKLNNNKKALAYLTKTYKEYKHVLNQGEGLYTLTTTLGAVYLDRGEYDRTTHYYNEALEAFKVLQVKTSANVLIFFNLSELEFAKGNYYKSRSYLRTYYDYKQYYDAKERNDKVIEMQEHFNATDRQAQILRLKSRNQQAKLSYYKLQNGIIVSLVLLGLLVTLLFYRQRKKEQALKIERKNELKRAALEASENEKLRFSRDLHDTLGGSLTLISLLVNQAGDKNPDQVSDFNKLYDIVQGSITDLRRVCRDMYPSEILVSGVINSLKNFYLRLGTIHASFNFNFEADDLKLEKGFSVNMYRILQELTNNTFKYAEATSVEVNIQKDGEELRILFRDNGKGVELNDLLKGVGLNSIEERTKAYKGNVKFNSSSGNGFTAVMRFPFNEIVEKETV